MHWNNIPVVQIAKQLGFCQQTIYNELRRGRYERIVWKNGYQRDIFSYSADKSQQSHNYNQTAKGRPLKIGNDHAYAKFLEDKMLGIQANGQISKRKRLSPEVALHMAKHAGFAASICTSTLYSYIDKRVFLRLTNKDL